MNEEEYPGRGRVRTANELILPRGEFAYTRDKTSGVTSVRCGPTVINMQGSEEPIVFDPHTNRFNVIDLQEAAQVNTTVPTGHYAVMHNPSKSNQFPEPGNKNVNQEMLIGQRVHIPGPVSFALWPRQGVKVISGHQLRSNQYLIVNVYDEEAARASWSSAVVKTVEGEAEITPNIPEDLTVGRLSVIRGSQVAFYIPPTGMEVVPGEDGNYVREALTLERLQYCILIDESGEKRYVRGPDVVFPLPTERFYLNEKSERLFRPIELNGSIQGLHIKVIAAYTDNNGDHGLKGEDYTEGEELFITGETTPIYFPCEQHSAIRYDGKTKHFATAITAGDGRYVLHRHTGAIRMNHGGEEGTMSLPDPRTEVFVRRVLTDAESLAMYPGNAESLAYNQQLRAIQMRAPTTRKGAVSEGDLSRGMRKSRGRQTKGLAAGAEFADVSNAAANHSAEMAGDEFTRAASYTEPRMVTVGNDKFAGVPKISPWTGFAVMVVDTAGNRRVVHGPQRILLGFNETLETLALSTGKPKNTDHLLNTAYLRVEHNKVSDVIDAETSDHVRVRMKVALRVNFEGEDSTRWFAVSNYVKLLTDHVRSVLKAAIRRLNIEEFYSRSEDFIRDTLLGAKDEDGRVGMPFAENGMRVYDAEVLEVSILDNSIQALLNSSQHEAVQSSIEIARDQRRFEATVRREGIQRETMKARAETAEFATALDIERIALELSLGLSRIKSTIEAAANAADIQRVKDRADNALSIHTNKEAVRLEALAKETQATVAQLQATAPGFAEALLALGNQETMVKVAEAMSVQNFVGGKDLSEVLSKVFSGTPMEALSKAMIAKALPQQNGRTEN